MQNDRTIIIFIIYWMQALRQQGLQVYQYARISIRSYIWKLLLNNIGFDMDAQHNLTFFDKFRKLAWQHGLRDRTSPLRSTPRKDRTHKITTGSQVNTVYSKQGVTPGVLVYSVRSKFWSININSLYLINWIDSWHRHATKKVPVQSAYLHEKPLAWDRSVSVIIGWK